MEPSDHATEYEQLVAVASRVDQLVREVETWPHTREWCASTARALDRQHHWWRRRVEILRHSQALLAALLRDIEL